jgi:purine nucleosidase
VTTAILLDCDPGIDDTVALLYLARLVQTGAAELAAVGSVHGNVAPDVGARNALRVLECAGLDGVPVALGAARPMAQPVGYAHGVHGDDGMGNSGLPEPRGRLAGVSAPEQILRLARERPGELTLLAIGPLTNLGIALLLDPELPARLREVVIMGGALDHPGNITSHAEANIWHDPEAAELVLSAGWPVTLVPLDATHPAAVDEAWLDRLAAGDSDTARLATRVLDYYAGVYQAILGSRGAVIHDAVAAMLAIDPALGQYTERPVHVELGGQRLRGATVWDRRRSPGDDPRPRVKVATGLDVATFRDRLIDSLL